VEGDLLICLGFVFECAVWTARVMVLLLDMYWLFFWICSCDFVGYVWSEH
jgi:hypothetical protein